MKTDNNTAIPVNPLRIVTHNLTLSRINIIKEQSSSLSVAGVKDHAGLKKVVKTRRFIKKTRLNVEVRRREINADMLREIRENNFAARFIINELKPSEKYLHNIEKSIANEKEAIKLEKKRIALERLQKRIDALSGFDVAVNIAYIKDISDKEFTILLDRAKFDYTARQEQKAMEAKRLSDENSRLKEENKKLKESVEPPAMLLIENAGPVVVADTPVQNDTSPTAPVQEDISEIKLLVKNYALALKAVQAPSFKNEQARAIVLSAQAHINTGINMLLKAVE